MRVAVWHGRIIVDPEPVFDPLSRIARHMVQPIGASSLRSAGDRRYDGNLVDVILSEHREGRRGRFLPPGKEVSVFSSRGFFPLGFRREPLSVRTGKVRCLRLVTKSAGQRVMVSDDRAWTLVT
jgi:hypothetical protein